MEKGEVYYVSIPYATGCEIQKNRPAVIVSNDLINEKGSLVTVVFLTTSDRHPDMRSHVNVMCKGERATALVEQMTNVDRSRIQGYVGRISDREVEDIGRAIAWHLGLLVGEAVPSHVRDGEGEKVKVERDLLMRLVREAMA